MNPLRWLVLLLRFLLGRRFLKYGRIGRDRFLKKKIQEAQSLETFGKCFYAWTKAEPLDQWKVSPPCKVGPRTPKVASSPSIFGDSLDIISRRLQRLRNITVRLERLERSRFLNLPKTIARTDDSMAAVRALAGAIDQLPRKRRTKIELSHRQLKPIDSQREVQMAMEEINKRAAKAKKLHNPME